MCILYELDMDCLYRIRYRLPELDIDRPKAEMCGLSNSLSNGLDVMLRKQQDGFSYDFLMILF